MKLVVPPTLSVIVSIWMETLFYGVNIAVYALCLYVLFFGRSSGSRSNKILIALSTTLFLTATGHVSVNLRRLIEGYVHPPTKEAMTAYLLDITQPTNVAKQCLVVLANLFSDILILWRVYTVWEKQWKICVIPLFLCLGTFTSGMATAAYENLVIPGQSIFLKNISTWGLAQFSLSLTMNVIATILIASRIWYVTRDVRRFNPEHMQTYWRVIILVIESASFAALAQVVELSFYAAKFPGVYFIADSSVQIISIAPLSIIVLVGLTQRNGSWGTSYPTNQELATIRFNEVQIALGARSKATVSTTSPDTRNDMVGPYSGQPEDVRLFGHEEQVGDDQNKGDILSDPKMQLKSDEEM
ncbi:hypothetical protein EW146_g1989 [Bondarzewia mesenterica]|uniref:Uncharacterized protein n=1 Tax=Bondarzewia mesenterica TaxID=1095465 RepID=A0A4S4M263_9AGAM|nr:hypothetical protein EW146_g1989 [Bondarzewia mesenterica]